MSLNAVSPHSGLPVNGIQNDIPSVTVVIPCYNEERFIGRALERLAVQYELSRYEIIVVDGLSTDRTREVIDRFKDDHPRLNLRVLTNPSRAIPAALNIGIRTATGKVIARMDAHAAPSPNYIRRCVEVLTGTGAGIVGMPCRVTPGANTVIARAIAAAVSHPFGIGDAKYRLQTSETSQQSVDTVAFACFHKSLWVEIGGYDETLLTNEDYDFNYRVKLSGKEVLLDQSEYTNYYARSTIGGLAKQYARYGSWKARMVLKHPASIKLRHLIAPLFVLSLVVLLLVGIWFPIAWWLLLFELGLYLLLCLVFGVTLAQKTRNGVLSPLVMPITFLTIHSVWGVSFILGLFIGKKPSAETTV